MQEGLPMSPVTPETTSSLRNSIGRGSKRDSIRFCFRCCMYSAMDVDVTDREKPSKMPYRTCRAVEGRGKCSHGGGFESQDSIV